MGVKVSSFFSEFGVSFFFKYKGNPQLPEHDVEVFIEPVYDMGLVTTAIMMFTHMPRAHKSWKSGGFLSWCNRPKCFPED